MEIKKIRKKTIMWKNWKKFSYTNKVDIYEMRGSLPRGGIKYHEKRNSADLIFSFIHNIIFYTRKLNFLFRKRSILIFFQDFNIQDKYFFEKYAGLKPAVCETLLQVSFGGIIIFTFETK